MFGRGRGLLVLTAAIALAAGCSESGFIANDADMGVGVGQCGAQDFGLFKEILEAGGLPGPSTIDDVGFFAEHKIELPPPACGETLCAHAQIGHMGNLINGADCTIVQIGLNARPEVLEADRPPLHLALVIDTSGSMNGQAMQSVRRGLGKLVDALEEGDRISLILGTQHG